MQNKFILRKEGFAVLTQGNQNRKTWIWGAGIFLLVVIAVIVVAVLVSAGAKEEAVSKQPGITEQIRSYQGLTTVMSQEEYDFFESLAKKQVLDLSDEKLIEQTTKEVINRELAQIYLGSKLGFCQPYSFQNIQVKMEQENHERRIKQENGEVVYGVKSFDLLTYFEYLSSNLRTDLVSYLSEHMDAEIDEKARAYYEEHQDDYKMPDPVVYTITEDGTTENFEADWNQLKTLDRIDSELVQILMNAAEGESYSYQFHGSEREVFVSSITYRYSDYESAKTVAVRGFLESGYYEELLREIAANNPVQFP